MKKYTKIAIAILAATTTLSSALAEDSMGRIESIMRGVVDMAPREVAQKIQEKVLEEKKTQTPQVLDVNGQGQIRLRGIVSAISSTTISIKTWGGIWTVLPGISPEIISKDKTVNSISIGDYVGVQGLIVPDTTLTVQGNIIRNRSWKEELIRNNVPKMMDDVREINPQNTFSPKKNSPNPIVPIVSNMPTTIDVTEINPNNTFSPKKINRTPAPAPTPIQERGSGIMVEGSKPPARDGNQSTSTITIPLNY